MWLEVTYQGLAPPTDLFADLELVGWAPPTLAPPPHDAIDWSRPNEATGERFTLRDYTVAGAVVQAPGGSAVRGAWTDTERTSHLAALGRVLARHPDIEVDDPTALVRAPAATASLPPPPVAAAAPSTTTAQPAPFRPSADTTAVLITAPLKPSLAPRAEDALIALGVTVVFDSQERVKTERYRGSTYETTVTQLHLAAIAAPEQLDAVVATLQGLGLSMTFAEVDDADVAPDLPPGGSAPAVDSPSPDDAPTEVRPAQRRDVGVAGVIALADPRTADAVAGVIRSLGLLDASVTATTRPEVSTYRGSRSERQVPTIRVEAWVPEPHARLVANHLAEATRLRVDDPARLWIVPPEPANDPAAPTELVAEPTTEAGSTSADETTASLPPPPAATDRAVPALDPHALVRRPEPAYVDHVR